MHEDEKHELRREFKVHVLERVAAAGAGRTHVLNFKLTSGQQTAWFNQTCCLKNQACISPYHARSWAVIAKNPFQILMKTKGQSRHTEMCGVQPVVQPCISNLFCNRQYPIRHTPGLHNVNFHAADVKFYSMSNNNKQQITRRIQPIVQPRGVV